MNRLAFLFTFFIAATAAFAADDLTATASVFSDYNGEDVSCVGSCDGIATVSATGGTMPYSYLWSDGQLAQVAIGLCAGTYTVIVTDATGCADTVAVTLNDPAPFDVNVTPFEYVTGYNVTCPGATDGSATANVTGGIGPYTYLWSNTQTTPTAVGLPALPLAVQVTDQNGCVTFDSLWMHEPDPFSADSSLVLDLSCPPNVDGQIVLNITGGNGSYAYSWADGSSAGIRTNLSPGTYTVTVTDIMGCTFTEDFDINEATPITTTFSNTPESCEAYLDGAIDMGVAGGTAPYSYKWDNGSSAEDPAGLGEGLYKVTIMDSRGCAATAATNVGRVSRLTISSMMVQPGCGEANGKVAINVQGADGSLSYAWSDGQTAATAVGLPADEYSVLVMDASCSVSRDFALSSNAPLNTDIAITSPGCLDDNGSLVATPVDGVSPYTYLWSDGQTTATATNLAAGAYQLRIEDAAGCVYYEAVSLEPNSDLSASITSTTPSSCGFNDGSLLLNVSGGLPPYSIDWSTGSDSLPTQLLRSGDYWATVTDLDGCETIAVSKLEDPVALSIAIQSTLADCSVNSGLATSVVSGGAGSYNYSWSNGDTLSNIVDQFLGQGMLYVSDTNGCLSIASYEIEGSLGVRGIAEPDGISCASFEDGMASIEVLDGLPDYVITWGDGQTGPMASGLSMGDIAVELVDSANCLVNTTLEIGDGCDTLLDAIVDDYSVLEGLANNLEILVNDIIPSRGGITMAVAMEPTNGTVEEAELQSLDYTPFADYVGLDSMTYVICDYAEYCDTATVYLTVKPQFNLPQAFSPNNDGLNDFFEIKGIAEFPDNEFVVVNRWGDEVFRQKGYMGDWNGTFKNGEPLTDGTYYYVLDLKNGEEPMAGYLVLQR